MAEVTTTTTRPGPLVEPSPSPLLSEPEDAHYGRLRWGAIFGGAVAALGIWALLYAFGLAVGFSAIDPADPGSLRGSGIFTGLWGIFAPLLALFVGGLIASRSAGVVTKGMGGVHGLVMWGLTAVVGTWLLGSMIGGIAGGLGRGIAPTAEALGVDFETVLAPINERLEAEGRPTVSAGEVETAAQAAVQRGFAEGRFDRELLVSSLAQNTQLSPQDAEMVAAEIEQSVQPLQAAEGLGVAFWGLFGALFLGLVAAVGGGMVGASYKVQEMAARKRHEAAQRLPRFRHEAPAT